jgi:hypothetical protein
MKRDMDLVRKILLEATAREGADRGGNPRLAGYMDDQVTHPVYLMQRGGLVEAATWRPLDGSPQTAILTSVTWAGHDFLDAARNETVWNQARAKAGAAGVELSFATLKELLVATAKGLLGLP